MKHARADVLKTVVHVNLSETTNVVCVRPRDSEPLRIIKAQDNAFGRATNCHIPENFKRNVSIKAWFSLTT